jgi:serine/threonine protein kinase
MAEVLLMTEPSLPEESIFAQALEIASPSERAAFLDRACGNNRALRAEVEALLRAHEKSGDLLDLPEDLPLRVDPSACEGPGAVIGPYKLLEQIGEGGFGVVFMAEQHKPIRRKVALKVVKPGMDTRQVVARFEAERQALALMDHPNIAKVLDAGQTDNGRPYFVMDLVKGLPITDFCDQSQLTSRERLELFVLVCQAVQHAHQKGIIHRDLKPSNVLVTVQDGAALVKVIDFGIAKAMGQQLIDKTVFTGFAQMIGTPLYMSPEQAALSNVDVDTRSDIYSLGVLLYELLTGTTPFDKERLRTVGYDEMRRILREEEPPKPSTRLSTLGQAATTISTQRQSDPRRLCQFLRGDLDWIVMRALAKDRNERYATAKEFADDVVRFLDDRPVQARPPTWTDRLRKWARRHTSLVRAAAALAALAVVALAVGALLLSAKNRELALANVQEGQARAQAETNFELAKESINEFVASVTEDRHLQMRGELHDLRHKLLASAVPFLEKLGQQKPGAEAIEVQRAWAYGRLGVVRQQMGEVTKALADAEAMKAILEQLAHDHPATTAYRRDLARAHTNRGAYLKELHRTEEALAAFAQAQAFWEELTANALLNDPEQAKNYIDRGNLLQDLRRYEEAVADYQAALAILDKAVADLPRYRREQAVTRSNLANALRPLGRRQEALAALTRAAQIQDELLTEAPGDPLYGADLGATRLNLGNLLLELNRPKDAQASYVKVLTSMEPLAVKYPSVPRPRQYQAMAYNSIVYLLLRQRRFDEALTYSQNGLRVQERLVADFPKTPQYRSQLATAYMNNGTLLTEMGRGEEGLVPLQKALALHEALVADFPGVADYAVSLGGSYCNMGAVLNDLNRPADAQAYLAKALSTLDKVLAGERAPANARRFRANTLTTRAETLTKLHRYAEALRDWDEALPLMEGSSREVVRLGRANTLVRCGKPAEAVVEADAVAQANGVPFHLLYGAACIYALASSAMTEDTAKQERYAVRAVELLGNAIDRGFKDAEKLQKDSDLERLKLRADYQKVMQRIASKNKP